MKKGWHKRLGLAVLGAVGGALLFGWATNRAVLTNSEGKIYADVHEIPSEPVGLVLGTAATLGGYKNPFFERRMDAAATLYKAGKVKKLLVSGDNGSKKYDEPTAMQQALTVRGIPAKDVVLDYAGFRTLDSVVRAREIFGVDHVTIVTDDFHLPRALYIATEKNLHAVGFQTAPLPRHIAPWTYAREVGARSLVWLDLHILNRQPKFLGPREPMS